GMPAASAAGGANLAGACVAPNVIACRLDGSVTDADLRSGERCRTVRSAALAWRAAVRRDATRPSAQCRDRVTGAWSAEGVAFQDLLRGPASVLALSASYVVGRSAAAPSAANERGLRKLSASLERAAIGAAAAIRIGRQVRNAPVLRSRPGLLARPEELVPVCTLISDTHVIASGGSLCELDADPGQWPWREMPTCEVIAGGLVRVLEHVRQHAPHTVIWCGDEVDTGEPAEWQQWRQVIDGVPRLMHRLVPG